MSSKPIFSLSRDDRLAALRPFSGLEVRLVVDRYRNGDDLLELEGRVLAVATPGSSVPSDVVVLKEEGYHPRAFSAATIRSIAPISEQAPARSADTRSNP